jgi:cysteine desulfurase/selenocysteine lyase
MQRLCALASIDKRTLAAANDDEHEDGIDRCRIVACDVQVRGRYALRANTLSAMTSENDTPGGGVDRAEFPAFDRRPNQQPCAYLDNAATTQMPLEVIEAVSRISREGRANVHRGVYAWSERATAAYEGARETSRRFINAGRVEEIVFVRGATEAINLVAHSYGNAAVGRGDEVLVTWMEHHSNIVPWQMLCERVGARLRVVPVTEEGELRLVDIDALIGPRTRLLAITHVSNAIGTVNAVREITALAHDRRALVLIDGAQAAAHLAIDVQSLGCDFYVLSAHKCYGPTGIGLLYGRANLLEGMPPFFGGGEMVRSVSFERPVYGDIPHKFEAGTPNIEGAVGMAAAFDYLIRRDRDALFLHEQQLLAYATERLEGLRGVRIIGRARHKAPIASFTVDGAHAHDVATVLDQHGVAVRAGHHCAQPLVERFGVPATVRASMGMYNTRADIDALVFGLVKAVEIFR